MSLLRSSLRLAFSSLAHALITSVVLAALAVPAAAQLQFEELPRKGLPIVSDYTQSVAFGDVDGDGDLDMVIGNGLSTLGQQNRLYLNNGTGTFTDATASQMPVDTDTTLSVALGDIDGDGDLDIVIGNWPQNRLYLNNGTGTFTDVSAVQMPVGSGALALGDVDGDGDLDIVSSGSLYLNDGAGTFTDVSAAQMPAGGSGVAALGDVDGDLDLDLVIGAYGQNRLYLNNGSGTFSDATASQMPLDNDITTSLALGDVDGDGDLDMVIGNWDFYGAQNHLYLNNGTGTFSDATANQMPADGDNTESVALGDVDGDGDLDMVLGNSNVGFYQGQNRLYLNNGTGTFTDVSAVQMPVGIGGALALGDVDGDGDLDVVIGNGGPSNQDRLYLNLQRQLHAPTAPQLGQPYSLDAYMRYGAPSTADIAAVYLSTASLSIPLGTLGTLGIDPAQAALFPTLILPQPAGVGSVGFTVPNVASLVGQAIYSQAMLVAYPNELRLSNVVADVIQ